MQSPLNNTKPENLYINIQTHFGNEKISKYEKTYGRHFSIEVQSNPDLVTFKIVKNPELVKDLPLTEFLLMKNLQNSKILAFL